MNIFVNEILVDYQTKKKCRILWITQGNKFAYIIDMDEMKALPVLKSVNEIIEDVLEGKLYKEKSNSEWRGDGKTSERALVIRDDAWKMIKDVINKEPDIYSSEKRGKIIQEIMIKHQTTKPTIYKHLRRYWQRGKTPNGLIPDYMNSGGKGKPKQPTKKMGRPSKFKEIESKLVVDERIKKIFRLSLQSYYFNQKKIVYLLFTK